MFRLRPRIYIGLLVAAIVYWLLSFFIVSLGVLLDSGEWRFLWQRFGAYSLSIIPAYLTGIVIYAMFTARHAARWPFFILAFALTSFLHGALYTLMYKYAVPLDYFRSMSFWQLTLSVTLVNCTLAGVWQLIIVTWVMARKAIDNEHRAAKAENLAQSAQLEMLRYQLNPHFLFNTLNSISSLVVEKRNDDAEDMIMKLSQFLRRSLDTDPTDLITVEAELEAIDRYLSIEQNRFSDRLTVHVSASPDARNLLLPPLILQPLIENTIKHAVSGATDAIHIEISARIVDGYLVLSVADNGPGLPDVSLKEGDLKEGALKEGVGLGNIRMRLSLLFGRDSDLTLTTRDEGGTAATITMPRIEAAQ
ncbi:hypothetical protein FF098_000335 [Parvularcula flava]|uniref:Histidine kinase n=1 Tax=Aquisalinus luteolus TaxID=1566827 RepID=A0A8J3ENW9_9PROT|nr:histidine kinase [Aquisalinus luteolus]NHK26349.1 hypothetical protein [Aquisalinus luteolus]GGH92064.1 hypothetical protein GCM10011355_00680 [Aquisalinus luteolus]